MDSKAYLAYHVQVNTHCGLSHVMHMAISGLGRQEEYGTFLRWPLALKT